MCESIFRQFSETLNQNEIQFFFLHKFCGLFGHKAKFRFKYCLIFVSLKKETYKPMRKLKNTELIRKSTEEFKTAKKTPIVVVLDNVRSLSNIGSVFRTCDAFLIEAICLCGITATPPRKELHKTALGAENTVCWEYFKTTEEAIKNLTNNKFEIYAIEQVKNSISLEKFKPNASEKYALVFGNEVYGVQQGIVDACNGSIEIPQFGTKHSFNISVSCGIVLWDFFSKINLL